MTPHLATGQIGVACRDSLDQLNMTVATLASRAEVEASPVHHDFPTLDFITKLLRTRHHGYPHMQPSVKFRAQSIAFRSCLLVNVDPLREFVEEFNVLRGGHLCAKSRALDFNRLAHNHAAVDHFTCRHNHRPLSPGAPFDEFFVAQLQQSIADRTIACSLFGRHFAYGDLLPRHQ